MASTFAAAAAAGAEDFLLLPSPLAVLVASALWVLGRRSGGRQGGGERKELSRTEKPVSYGDQTSAHRLLASDRRRSASCYKSIPPMHDHTACTYIPLRLACTLGTPREEPVREGSYLACPRRHRERRASSPCHEGRIYQGGGLTSRRSGAGCDKTKATASETETSTMEKGSLSLLDFRQ